MGLLSRFSVAASLCQDDFLRDKEPHLKGMFSLPLLAT